MNNNNTPRSPTLVESLLPILAMILLLGFGYAAFDLPPEPLMVLSTVIAALLVKRLGYGYNAILESISQKIAKTMPALLILISVGLLIGTWMIGGTIPLMIYYGLNLINPSMIYVTALLVTAIVSVCTGTSWGSAGTVGVAFMGVAIGMEANLAATAGAIVAGAYFAPHRMQIESLKGGFFCVWDPLVTYLSRYFNSLRANQFQPIANEKCWYRRWYFRFDINLY
nr:hypothetical protein [Escherichia coli]